MLPGLLILLSSAGLPASPAPTAVGEPGAEEGPRVLILGQAPAHQGGLRVLADAGAGAGVRVDHRMVTDAATLAEEGLPRGLDLLVIDSPYASRLGKLMQILEPELAQQSYPVLYVARRGYVPALRLPEEAGRRLSAYYQNGGQQNRAHFFAYLKAHLVGSGQDAIPEPALLPDAGIYHPDYAGGIFGGPLDYLEWRGTSRRRPDAGPDAPLVAVAVHRSYLVNGLTGHIDATVRRIEDAGGQALVYFHPPRDADSLRRLLMLDGTVLPQVIINYRAVFDAGGMRRALDSLGVPVLQALVHKEDAAAWDEDPAGWPFARIPFYMAQPEAAGVIDPLVVAATGRDGGQVEPMEAQLAALVDRALAQARLRTLDNGDKRIGVLYYNNPPGERHLKASFLNVSRSLSGILSALHEAGYRTSPMAEERIIEQAQAMLAGYYRPQTLAGLLDRDLAALLPLGDYLSWFAGLPGPVRARIQERWGEPGESRMLVERDGRRYFAVPRLRASNLVLLPQPLRGGPDDDQSALQHDKKVPLNHGYLAAYLWLRTGFEAHALVHLGTHGTHEWAPGKERAPGVGDDPVLAVGELPVVYPYIVDDLGEAIQAKRRGTAAIVSHQTPPFAPSGLYRELAELHELLHRYAELEQGPVKRETRAAIIERVTAEEIDRDMGWDRSDMEPRFDAFLDALHLYLHGLAEESQPLGLHSFGAAPAPEHLLSTLVQMLGREYLQAAGGPEWEELLAASYESVRDTRPFALLREFLQTGINPSGASESLVALLELGREYADRLRARGEMPGLLRALEGRFLTARIGGDPVRTPAALPTGTNLYSFDPDTLPTPEAHKAGVELMERYIRDYRERHGRYPRKIAFSLWSTEAMRHHGVIEAKVLHALGTRPVWDERGRVSGVEPIPAAELKRPRVDVVISATGLYRDTFEGPMRLIARAVEQVAALDEAGNQVRANTLDVCDRLRAEGVGEADARDLALVRVFAPEIGSYGTGLPAAILDSGSWDEEAPLAQLYLERMQYAYGADNAVSGQRLAGINLFAQVLAGTEAAVLARSSNLYGMLASDDPFQNLGGLALAVRHLGGEDPELVIANLRDADKAELETAGAFLARELRTRTLHPGWIRVMQQEGYAGTTEILERVNNLWGWETTAPKTVRDDQWQSFAEVYVDDKYALGIREWFETHNPSALADMLERMLEAVRKGYWQASDETLQTLVGTRQELSRSHDISVGNRKLAEYIARQMAGFGLAAVQASGGQASATQPVRGQRLEALSPAAEASSRDRIWWIAFVIAAAALFGYLRQSSGVASRSRSARPV